MNETPQQFDSKLKDFKVQLETFEGPLDLLLHLIKEKEMDIFSISLSQITGEYLEYVQAAQDLDLSIAGEYLVVAASLIRIKSRSLLPREEAPLDEEEEVDEEGLLLRRLEEYQRFKTIADVLRTHEESRQSTFVREAAKDEAAEGDQEEVEFFEVDIFDLYSAFKRVMEQIEGREPREIQPEEFTVDEKMAEMLLILNDQARFSLPVYLMACRSRLEVIVIFLALLELIRQGKVRARQIQGSGEIWLLRPH